MPQAAWNNLRVLVPLLIAALFLVDLAALAALRSATTTHFTWQFLTWALALSQVGIVAAWIGLGGGQQVPRLAILLALSAFWVIALGHEISLLFWVQAAATIGVMIYARAFWPRLALINIHGNPQSPEPLPPRPLQFSLKHLFACTTLVAMVLFLARQEESGRLSASLVLFGFSAALVVPISMWAALAMRQCLRRILIGLVLAPFVGAMGQSLQLTHPVLWDARLVATVACGLQCFLTVGCLTVFRLGGYRLTWTPVGRSTPVLLAE